MPDVFQTDVGEQYVRLEEIKNGDELFGDAADVTAETARRLDIEKERDADGLKERNGEIIIRSRE